MFEIKRTIRTDSADSSQLDTSCIFAKIAEDSPMPATNTAIIEEKMPSIVIDSDFKRFDSSVLLFTFMSNSLIHFSIVCTFLFLCDLKKS